MIDFLILSYVLCTCSFIFPKGIQLDESFVHYSLKSFLDEILGQRLAPAYWMQHQILHKIKQKIGTKKVIIKCIHSIFYLSFVYFFCFVWNMYAVYSSLLSSFLRISKTKEHRFLWTIWCAAIEYVKKVLKQKKVHGWSKFYWFWRAFLQKFDYFVKVCELVSI